MVVMNDWMEGNLGETPRSDVRRHRMTSVIATPEMSIGGPGILVFLDSPRRGVRQRMVLA